MPTPTIVLLHGQPDSSASFWPLRRELLGRLPAGVRVLAPDRPGYGANPLQATGYAGNVDWLQNWLAQVQAGPTVLVGHSWAGGVAALAAARQPASVAGLVLLTSVGPDCLLRSDRVLAAPVLGDLITYAALRLPLLRRSARSTITDALTAADLAYGRSSMAAMRRRPVWRSFLIEQRALIRELPELNAALPLITAPTAVISGDRDSVIPPRTPIGLLASIRHASGHQVEGGHDLQLRQPAEVAELIAGLAAAQAGFSSGSGSGFNSGFSSGSGSTGRVVRPA
ncbi:MAG: alpha/beta hydrolase [Jatrophihabitantaceae bacterium]